MNHRFSKQDKTSYSSCPDSFRSFLDLFRTWLFEQVHVRPQQPRSLFFSFFQNSGKITHTVKHEPLIQCIACNQGARYCEEHGLTRWLLPRQDGWNLSPLSVCSHPQLSYVMSGYRCFVCPVEYNNDTNSFTVDCEPSGLFRLQEYNIPGVIQSIIGWVCTTHMGRMILGWLVTTEREPPLHHCLPSKNLASSLPKAVNPRMEENCLSQFWVGTAGDVSSYLKLLRPEF